MATVTARDAKRAAKFNAKEAEARELVAAMFRIRGWEIAGG